MIRCLMQALGALTFLIFAHPAGPARAETHVMADKPEFEYVVTARAENMVARLYVNGAPLIFHAQLAPMNFTFPITKFLREGENTFTVDYEPIDPDARTYTPHAGVRAALQLDQRATSGSLGKIDIFSGQHDVEAGTLVASEVEQVTGLPLRTQAGVMQAPARYTVTPVNINYPDRPTGEFARRLSVTFTIADPALTTLPQEDAQVLQDTPEMRADLYDAYAAMHRAVGGRDVDTYRALMQPVLGRMAHVLGYSDTAAVLEAVFKLSPFGGPEGSTLRPLMTSDAMQSAHLNWSVDRRMVSVTPNPMGFRDASGAPAGGYRVMFCRVPDGPFLVCHQQDIPYSN